MLNYDFYFCISFEKDNNPYFWSKSSNELANKLIKLMTIYSKNLFKIDIMISIL